MPEAEVGEHGGLECHDLACLSVWLGDWDRGHAENWTSEFGDRETGRTCWIYMK